MQIQKTILATIAFFMLSFTSFASLPSVVTDETTVVNKHAAKIKQLEYFVSLSTKDYEKKIGKKLNFFQKATFKLSQKRARKTLKQYISGTEPTTISKISWFIKGMAFGPLALIAGYLFLKDDDRQLIKWIWFGFGLTAIILAVILLVV